MNFYVCFFMLSITIHQLLATPVDNSLVGDPEIECGPSFMMVNFNTQNSFEGHVYVKGHFDEKACRTDATQKKNANIELPFSACGMKRERRLNPPGMVVSTTVIISFHPKFVTKVDRAIKVECFYMEASKTVTAELDVSMLTTVIATHNVQMPQCRYEVLNGGPTGRPIRYAIVGQPVYHKWSCDTETTDTFCMTVHSCFVDDGHGDKVLLVDENGCAQDRYILKNLDYLGDLMAGQESHVFKYADKTNLFFQCQVRIAVKEPKAQCKRPACAPVERGRRSAKQEQEKNEWKRDSTAVYLDVSSPDLTVLDNENTQGGKIGDKSLLQFLQFNNSLVAVSSPSMKDVNSVCISKASITVLIAMGVFMTILLLTFTVLFVCLRKQNHNQQKNSSAFSS